MISWPWLIPAFVLGMIAFVVIGYIQNDADASDWGDLWRAVLKMDWL